MKAGIEINQDTLHEILTTCLAYLTSPHALEVNASQCSAKLGNVGGYDVYLSVVDKAGDEQMTVEINDPVECVRGELE